MKFYKHSHVEMPELIVLSPSLRCACIQCSCTDPADVTGARGEYSVLNENSISQGLKYKLDLVASWSHSILE